MIRKTISRLAFLTLTFLTLVESSVFAKTLEVLMLNKGSDGERMVFEPSFLQIAAGDTIKFIATDRGHNAQTVSTMIPKGTEGFVGKINEEIEVTLDREGVYGIMCKPHYAMGMVMVVAVGDGEIPDDFLKGRIPPRAKKRFRSQLENL